MSIRAVIFDLGGVVFPSPLDAFRAYEQCAGLPHRFISEVVIAGGNDGPWARLERGELTTEAFVEDFEAECVAAGASVSVTEILAGLRETSEPRPEMVDALGTIRAAGLMTAALTNNWIAPEAASARAPALARLFDVVVESAREGIRKPDPRIYELACRRLDITPSEAVFLDDFGVNLKPARALGMATIKVGDPHDALATLGTLLGLPLNTETN